MNPQLPLKDIQGLDAISFWPLAPGWWLVLGLLLFAAVGILAYQFNRRQGRQLLKELKKLDRELTPENAKATALTLALTLRRLAIQRFSRAQVAALKGQAWLKWLASSDPKKFDWTKAQFLIEAPYRNTKAFNIDEIRRALKAAKGWV